MGLKLEALPPFGGGELGPHVTVWYGPRPYLHTKWHPNPSSRLVTITWTKNWGAAVLPFWGRGAGSQSNHLTQCVQGRGLSPCQVSSWFIQPFGHNTPMSQTGQTDRQDNGPIAIGWTVLQTVAQKLRHVQQLLLTLRWFAVSNGPQLNTRLLRTKHKQ